MLICIDAGHYLGTPGKRCLKSIDPAETREWVLNSRVAEKVQARLAAYRCETMRADDPTGQREVTLAQRTRAANQAGADLYLSIHHNAGIKGGSGGGIVVYTAPGTEERSREVQRAVYEAAVEATGLRGNRARPTPQASLYVLTHTAMPAVLGEFGFMDSTTDTPIILTEEYADRATAGIVSALVRVYGLEEIELTETQVRAIFREELARAEAERAKRLPSEWASAQLAGAVRLGITDGSRPQSWATREEVALMVRAAIKG